MLVSRGPHNEGIQVTNDGATILKSIGVDNPAAKVLVGEAVDNNIRYHLDANVDSLSVSLSQTSPWYRMMKLVTELPV